MERTTLQSKVKKLGIRRRDRSLTVAAPCRRDADTEARAGMEREHVVAGPNGVAARLGMERTTLQSKMRKLGVRR